MMIIDQGSPQGRAEPCAVGGWCLEEQEGTLCRRSPACWSWSHSAAGGDSGGRSCSSAKTAREREKASERQRERCWEKAGALRPRYQTWAHLHVKNKQKMCLIKFLCWTPERSSGHIDSAVQICHTGSTLLSLTMAFTAGEDDKKQSPRPIQLFKHCAFGSERSCFLLAFRDVTLSPWSANFYKSLS